MGRNRKYTDKDIKFILENYKFLGSFRCGEKLGIEPHTVRTLYSRERRKLEAR